MSARPRFVPPRSRARGATGRARVDEVLARLARELPDADCALTFASPFQLLVATILSAQCTDERVNRVTPGLFARFPDARSMAQADEAELRGLVRSTGFFRNKARNLKAMAVALVERHGGEVPRDMDLLVRLPGVGRKTAHCVRGTAFGLPAVVVDTHVGRIARRLGWSRREDPAHIERDLARLVPEERWTWLGHALILHGRRTCTSQRPRCARCPLADLCPSAPRAERPGLWPKAGGLVP